MSEHCPQDGGFIGDAGCTHPNHQHSELVRGIVANAAPRGHLHLISEADAEAALKEGFYVKNKEGKLVGFGKKLLDHIDSDVLHSKADAAARKQRLIYAVQTVTHPDKVEKNHRSIPGRTAYAKAFDDFGILAITEPQSDTIEHVFTFFPRRGAKKRFAGTAANDNPSTGANYTTTSLGKARA